MDLLISRISYSNQSQTHSGSIIILSWVTPLGQMARLNNITTSVSKYPEQFWVSPAHHGTLAAGQRLSHPCSTALTQQIVLEYSLNTTECATLGNTSPMEVFTGQKPKSTADLLAFMGHTSETVTTSVILPSHFQACTAELQTLLNSISTRVKANKKVCGYPTTGTWSP